jgi:hypothetical protein
MVRPKIKMVLNHFNINFLTAKSYKNCRHPYKTVIRLLVQEFFPMFLIPFSADARSCVPTSLTLLLQTQQAVFLLFGLQRPMVNSFAI